MCEGLDLGMGRLNSGSQFFGFFNLLILFNPNIYRLILQEITINSRLKPRRNRRPKGANQPDEDIQSMEPILAIFVRAKVPSPSVYHWIQIQWQMLRCLLYHPFLLYSLL